ncbi:MAG: hypothetical protein QOH95_1451 [Gaiellaceae bacterium]|nr:hypothetical protein [Gaiellaceae bacterium]
MPNPYKARVDARRFLNLAGFHGGAYVVAYVEDTSRREVTKRDNFGYEDSRYVNPQPRIILEIADCSERISLEFAVRSELDVENSLHKVDVLLATLAEFRAGLVEEARLYRERGPEVERLNPSHPPPRRRRRRR